MILFSMQFFDRIKLFGMPAKHQPDLIYLRYVPLWKVHIFTVVQLTCLVLLWVIKASAAAVVFPMMVSFLVCQLIIFVQDYMYYSGSLQRFAALRKKGVRKKQKKPPVVQTVQIWNTKTSHFLKISNSVVNSYWKWKWFNFVVR